MAHNKFSVTLSSDEQKAIFDQVEVLGSMVHWGITLTTKERQQHLKAGDASEAFLTNALQMGLKYPGILPGNLDIKEMQKDVEMRPFLKDLRNRLQALMLKVDDSLLVCGGEAFEAGLQVYAGARNFGKGMGIDDQIDELGRRFKQSKSSSSSSSPS